MRKIIVKLLLIFVLAAVFVPAVSAAEDADVSYRSAVIYYNEACSGCSVYLQEKLVPLLKKRGLSVELKDYINDKGVRPELVRKTDELKIPLELQGHIMTFIDGGKVVLAGHVPLARVEEALASQYSRMLVVYQDVMLEMKGVSADDVEYFVWMPGGKIKSYGLSEPLNKYLQWYRENGGKISKLKEKSILPLVLVTGFLDGLNPCAFAVLLFFIAFLFTIKRTRKNVLKMGVSYIVGVYLIYVLIGLGLFKAITISSTPHFIAKIAAWLVIILGLINIINYFVPKFPLKLRVPSISKNAIQYWIERATIPTAFVVGILVGLCTFPCSGGIYVAIIGMLSVVNKFWSGLGYLLLYNVMFILPLVLILALATNKFAVKKLEKWEKQQVNWMHLLSGVLMLLLGVIILIFFV